MAALCLAGCLGSIGCGAAVTSSRSTTPTDNGQAEAELLVVGVDDIDTMTTVLAGQHFADLEIVEVNGLGFREGLAVVYALYIYSSFEAWQGMEVAAGINDDAEQDIWETSLRRLGEYDELTSEVDMYLRDCDERANIDEELNQELYEDLYEEAQECYDQASASNDVEGTSSGYCQLLEEGAMDALDESSYDACTHQRAWSEAFHGPLIDRVALALFSGISDGEGGVVNTSLELNGRTALDEPVTAALPTAFFPSDVDGDQELELFLELLWTEQVLDEESEDIYRVEHLELVIFEHDTQVQLRRRLVSNDEEALEGGSARQDARYWLEDRNDDGRDDVVIERFELTGVCELRDCTRYTPSSGVPPSERSMCFSRAGRGNGQGCDVQNEQQVVVLWDREHGGWL